MTYHDYTALDGLGQQVMRAAIEATVNNDDSYGDAQVQVINYPYQQAQGVAPALPGPYTPDTRSGNPGAREVKAFAEAEYADIPSKYTSFAMPDPDAGEPMHEMLLNLATALDPNVLATPGQKTAAPAGLPEFGDGHDNIDVGTFASSIEGRLESWRGAAAIAFRKYLDSFTRTAELQRGVAAGLAVLFAYQLELRRRLLDDVWSVGQKTIAHLKALEGFCPNTGAAEVTLTIVGVAAAVAASAESVLWMVASVVSGGETLIPQIKNASLKRNVGGATVPAAIANMKSVLDGLASSYRDQQQQLAESISAFQRAIDNNRPFLEVPRPFEGADLYDASADQLRDPLTGIFRPED